MRIFAMTLTALMLATSCASVERTLPAPLVFADFFQHPVGPRGLEPTQKLLQLDGQRVSVAGYMVREEEPTAGVFMLAPVPVSLTEIADGPADYLPGATLFVDLPAKYATQHIQFQPGSWQLVGTLDLGAREEPNGRISYVRLILDDLRSMRTPNDAKPVIYTLNDGVASRTR